MKHHHGHDKATHDSPPPWASWPSLAVFAGLVVVMAAVLVYVAQDVPQREVAARDPGVRAVPPKPEVKALPPAAPKRPLTERPVTQPERIEPRPEPPAPKENPKEHSETRVPPPTPEPFPETPVPPADESRTLAPSRESPDPEPAKPVSPPVPVDVPPEVETPEPETDVEVPSEPTAEPPKPSESPVAGPKVPEKAAIAATTKEVRQVFKAEYANRDPAARVAFAQRLCRDAANTTDDPTTAYVLATEAREQAIQAGDYETFAAAGRLLTEQFGVDTFDDDVNGLGRIPIVSGKTTSWYHGLIGEIADRVEACCSRDDFERATKYASIAKGIATKASDAATAQEWTTRAKELGSLKIQFGAYKAAKETLQANPSDAPANTKWGTYLCLVRGNFADGLPCLMKGDDATLAALAKRDSNPDRNASETIAVADAWWNYGEKSKAFRGQAWKHAGELYQSELSNLNGLVATKVEKRLAELAAAAAPPRTGPQNPVERALIAGPWSVHWDRAPRPRDIEGVRGGNVNVDENDWSHEETITFHEGGRVDSRYFDRYELGPDFIALYVPQDDNPPGFVGPPGRQRDRRFYGRARFMGNELQIIIFRGDRIDEPRNRGVATRQEAE